MGALDRFRSKADELAKLAKPKAEELRERAKPLAESLKERAERAGESIKTKANEVGDGFRDGYAQDPNVVEPGDLAKTATPTTEPTVEPGAGTEG